MPFKLGLMVFLSGLMLGHPAGLLAQTETDTELIGIMETLEANTDENIDYSELLERLNYFKLHPINLNTASESDFKELWILSPLQVRSFIQYRNENGALMDLLELQSVDNFDLKTIQLILPYVSIGFNNPFKKFRFRQLLSGKQDLMFRYRQALQKQEGFKISDTSKSRYLGSPQQVLFRYRYQYGRHLSWALNLEKDAGETFFKGHPAGFDFSSGHLAFKDLGVMKKLVLGDFDLQFGQGLALWSGLSFGKSAQINSLAKQDVGLKPYSSLNEGLYFRGLAASFAWKSFQFTPFFSRRNLDASISDNALVTSINISGLHRTPTEIANKNNLGQTVYGANLQWKYQNLNLGLTAYHTQLSEQFEPGQYLYNQFEFAGNKLSNFSLSYNYAWRNTYFFGEIAQSSASSPAFISGLISSLSPKVSWSLLYRNYPKNYHSFYNAALSEAGTAIDERAFYTGLSVKPNSKWEWNLYVDAFQFPWLKYGVDAPSKGFEILNQLIYKPHKRLQALVLYRISEKEQNQTGENTINYLETVRQQKIRFDLSYWINKSVQIRNRLEMVQYQSEHAYLTQFDAFYKPMQAKISGNFRFAVFQIPSFNSRIYAFQNDVLYSYSIFAYQNKGTQFYINGRYALSRGLDFWINYRVERYLNQETLGSGLSEINGNKRSEIKLQVRYQF